MLHKPPQAIAAAGEYSRRGLRVAAAVSQYVDCLVTTFPVGNTFIRRRLPRMIARFVVPDSVADDWRFIFGFIQQGVQSAFRDNDDPGGTSQGAWFLFRAGASANWLCRSRDAAGPAASTDSGVIVVAGATYELEIDCPNLTDIDYYVNGVKVATRQTVLPGLDSPAMDCYLAMKGLTPAADRDLKLDFVYYEES